jgi:hypothetical protein
LALPAIKARDRKLAVLQGVIIGAGIALVSNGITFLEPLKNIACAVMFFAEGTELVLAVAFVIGVFVPERIRNFFRMSEKTDLRFAGIFSTSLIVSYLIARVLTAQHLLYVECTSIFEPVLIDG